MQIGIIFSDFVSGCVYVGSLVRSEDWALALGLTTHDKIHEDNKHFWRNFTSSAVFGFPDFCILEHGIASMARNGLGIGALSGYFKKKPRFSILVISRPCSLRFLNYFPTSPKI